MMNRFREPVNGFTHLAGAISGVCGLILLVLLTRDDFPKMLSMLVYGLSLIAMYTASTVFHLTKGTPCLINRLRTIDLAAIYLLIAGTYTPFCYNALAGWWRWGMLGIIWTLAGTGILYKVAGRRPRRAFSALLYVGLGWLAVLILPKALTVLATGAIVLIVTGGVVYTVGALVFALKWPDHHAIWGHHEIWHLFVLGGSAFHFVAVALYIA
ncbi:hemolysin III family protein [Chloroflexota bacterium]